MALEAEDDEDAEENKEEDEHADATPEAVVLEAVVHERLCRLVGILHGELDHRQAREAVPDRGQVHEPGNVALGSLCEDIIEVDHVTGEQGQGHVHDWSECNGSRRVVEGAREGITHRCGGLDHKHEHEVKRDKVGELVLQAD